MAIFIKSEKEINGIRKSGRIVAKTLKLIEGEIIEGKSLESLEQACIKIITARMLNPPF